MRLFISYAREDTEQVKELVEILRSGGHEPWFDHGLTVGADWQEELLKAIKRGQAFVYTLTKASVESEWCLWEFAQAVELGKPIIPVLMQIDTPIPELISHRHYADFTEGATGDAVARLMLGLNNIAQKIPKRQAPNAPAKPRGAPARAETDVLYDDAVAIARAQGGISIRLLTRKLNIGDTRAGRIVDMIEAQGIVGDYPGGGKLRPLIVE